MLKALCEYENVEAERSSNMAKTCTLISVDPGSIPGR